MIRITFSLLLLVLCLPGNTDANRKVMKDAVLCFRQNEDTADVAECLAGISSCFEPEETVGEIQACIQENIGEIQDDRNTTASRIQRPRGDGRLLQAPGRRPGSFEGFEDGNNENHANKPRGRIARTCLQPYAECVREEIRGFVESLPACLKTSARALGMCYKENAATCASTCSVDDDIPSSNPFEGGSMGSIAFCGGFQKKIMDPSCAIVGCCAECTGEFEELMNCIVQDVGDLKPSPCELECPDDSRRRRLRRDRIRLLAEEEEDALEISDECVAYLDTKEDAMTIESINRKLLEGEFITCVQDAGLSIVADAAMSDAESTSAAGSRVLAANSMLVVLVGALLFGH